jgi:hypothetical protein
VVAQVGEAEGLSPVQVLAGLDRRRQPRRRRIIVQELTTEELAFQKVRALERELEDLRRDLTRYSAAVRRALLEVK